MATRPGPGQFKIPNFQPPNRDRANIIATPTARFPQRLNTRARYRASRGYFSETDSVAERMMLSKLFMIDEDSEWEPVKFIAKGGFGAVGLWQKRGTARESRVVDEIVMKQGDWNPDSAFYLDDPNNAKVSMEAVNQNRLNLLPNSENIVLLRRYKWSQRGADLTGQGVPGRYRYYFEYCPYSDLARLGFRYNIWDRYLDELFLWHVFRGMALAVHQMKWLGAPHQDPVTGQASPPPQNSIVHFDLKPGNVFLGYERSRNPGYVPANDNPTDQYPNVKVGDFGLSHETKPIDPINPRDLWHTGTPGWYAPEQFQLGAHWMQPPNGNKNYYTQAGLPRSLRRAKARQRADLQSGIKFGPAVNVFGIGKIMRDLATLDLPDTVKGLYDALTENLYQAQVEHEGLPPLATARRPGYSNRLINLIGECLKPDAELRIDIDELLQYVEMGLNYERAATINRRNLPGVPSAAEKIYFKASEINGVPSGPDVNGAFIFPPAQEYYNHVVDGNERDLDHAPLRPPNPKWAAFHNAWPNNPTVVPPVVQAAPANPLIVVLGVQPDTTSPPLEGKPRAVWAATKVDCGEDHRTELYRYVLAKEGRLVSQAVRQLKWIYSPNPLPARSGDPATRQLIDPVIQGFAQLHPQAPAMTRRQAFYVLRWNTDPATRVNDAVQDSERIYLFP